MIVTLEEDALLDHVKEMHCWNKERGHTVRSREEHALLEHGKGMEGCTVRNWEGDAHLEHGTGMHCYNMESGCIVRI